MTIGGEQLVRKTVTILFCDVVGSTALGESVDPETTRRVMLRYFDEARAVLERHGGTVEKFIGDAVVAVFGVPALHEDDALRAVRAADELRRALDGLNRELGEGWGVRLEWRIGINTGEVVVGDPSGTQTIASGDTVNVAARLQNAAQPGEILLGRETYARVQDHVTAGSLESFSLKGKSEGVKPWRLDEVRASADRVFRRLTSPIVGREAEQGVLHDVYRRVLEEQSCELVTVFGPAGIGKTRLGQEVAAQLFGATVAVGHCLPYGEGITLWPVVEILRELAGISADDSPDVALARLDALVSEGPDAQVIRMRAAGVLGFGSGARAQETFWALRRLFEELARPRPLVLVIEDLHWADASLLDLVEYLVGWSRGAPLLILCLARPELNERRPAWGRGDPNAHSLTLEPLVTDEVHTLLANLLGSADLEPRLEKRIESAADGNPLFVEELVRVLLEDGVLQQRDGAWTVAGALERVTIPPSISALLAARLDQLDPEEREVLQCAAVVGKEFWWGAVVDLAPQGIRDRVGPHLHALVRKRLISPAPSVIFTSEDSFQFGHILVRDTAYGALSKARRAELHETFADWLARKTAESGGDYSEIIGHHLEQAHRARVELGLLDESTIALGRRAGAELGAAGRRAVARDDAHAARSLLGRAANLLPNAAPERLELMAELGSVLIRAGEFAEATETFAEVARRAAASGQRNLELRAQIEQQWVRLFTDPEGSSDGIRALTESVIPELEEVGDDRGLARAWWLASEVHTTACRWGSRAAALERALEYAGRTEDKQQQATLIGQLAMTLVWGPTPVGEAISRCVDFYAHAIGDSALEASCLSALAMLHAMRGEIDEARDQYAQARAIYDELGLNFRRAARSLVPATVEMLADNPAAAERELRWGYETLAAMGEKNARSVLAAFLAEALCAQDRLGEADEFSGISAEIAGSDDIATQVVWRTARAKVYARRQRLAEAEQLARDAAELADSTDFPDLQARASLALAEVLLAGGRQGDAERLVRRAKEIQERKGNVVAARAVASLFAAYAR
jgi:class 3 adenylate cyclase/tetratricopeptide (TPR) repeat protein